MLDKRLGFLYGREPLLLGARVAPDLSLDLVVVCVDAGVVADLDAVPFLLSGLDRKSVV